MKTRKQIINGLRKLREECQLTLNAADYWNGNVRKPHEEPVIADPDGDLGRAIAAVDECLTSEKPDLVWEEVNPMTFRARAGLSDAYVALHWHNLPHGSKEHCSPESARAECEDHWKGPINFKMPAPPHAGIRDGEAPP